MEIGSNGAERDAAAPQTRREKVRAHVDDRERKRVNMDRRVDVSLC